MRRLFRCRTPPQSLSRWLRPRTQQHPGAQQGLRVGCRWTRGSATARVGARQEHRLRGVQRMPCRNRDTATDCGQRHPLRYNVGTSSTAPTKAPGVNRGRKGRASCGCDAAAATDAVKRGRDARLVSPGDSKGALSPIGQRAGNLLDLGGGRGAVSLDKMFD